MFQLSTMNLSMAVLNSWRSRSRLPSKNKGADLKAAVKRPAGNGVDENPLLESKRTRCFPADYISSPQCHLATGKQSSDDGTSCASTFTEFPDYLSRPASQVSTVSKTRSKEVDFFEAAKCTESYKILMDLSLCGLKMRQNLEEVHSILLKEQAESSIESGDSETLAQLLKLTSSTKEFSDKMMNHISSLFGVRNLGNYSVKVSNLHRMHVEDQKRIQELTAHIRRLESERSPSKRGRHSSFSADFSSMDADESDSEILEHNLSADTEEFIEYFQETMAEHGITAVHLSLWAEDREQKLSSTLISQFNRKLLTEERYQQLIPLVKEFLAEATQPGWVENYSAASPETTALIDKCAAIMKIVDFTITDFMNCICQKNKLTVTRSFFYNFMGKKLRDGQCAKIIPLAQSFVDEVADMAVIDGENEDLSTECLGLIDELNRVFEGHDLDVQSFNRWATRYGHSVSPLAISFFLKKKLKEETCQMIAPIVKQFLERKAERSRSKCEAKLAEETMEAIDKQKQAMVARGLTATRFIQWLEQQGQIVTPFVFSKYINKKVNEEKSQMLLPLVDKFLNETEEDKDTGVSILPNKITPTHTATHSIELSKETEEFIDSFRAMMSEYGMSNKDISEWLDSSDYDVQMSPVEIKQYLAKRVDENRCQEVMLAFRDLLEELTQNESNRTFHRRHFSAEAAVIMEETFRSWECKVPDWKTCEQLAEQLGDTPERVKRWFNKRRYKGKRPN